MAFSPNYATDGLFYVDYTAEGSGEIRVVEYKRSASNPNVADPTSDRPVLTVPHDQQYHNGGQLQFGADGMLYVSIGDNLTGSNAQDLTNNPYGKILRLNPASGAWSVWSYGLRNPWRFSFDGATGDIAIGDVGENTWEEIDWSAAPTSGQNVNWGWPDAEGPDGTGGQRPIITQKHPTFIAIIGGYVVHDPGLPTLNGRYIYGDNYDTRIWSAVPRTGADNKPTGLTISQLTSFGQDSCGHIYAASLAGHVYRLQDGAVSGCAAIATPDRTPPGLNVKLSGLRRALKTHRLRVAMRCSENCSATVGTRLKKVRRLKARHRDLAANQRKVVTLKLSKSTLRKLRKRLRHHSSVRVSVAVRATDAAGNSKTVHRRGRIRRHH
jgi:hypothetical protein